MESQTLLIVEDDASLRTIMQLLLEEFPHHVEFADAGAGALDRAASLDPDVVVIDMGLPDMSGMELARRLRASGSRARLVAFTGYDDAAVRKQASEVGFDIFYHKPIDLDSMEAIFNEIVTTAP